MRRFYCFFAALILLTAQLFGSDYVLSVAGAQESAREISAEEVLYEQGFDAEAENWNFINTSDWTVSEGQLVCSFNGDTFSNAAAGYVATEAAEWKNYALDADVTTKRKASGSYSKACFRVLATGTNAGNAPGGQGSSCYEARVDVFAGKYTIELWKMYLLEGVRKPVQVTAATLTEANAAYGEEELSYHIRIESAYGYIKVFIDGKEALRYETEADADKNVGTPYSKGSIGLMVMRSQTNDGTVSAKFDNLTVKTVQQSSDSGDSGEVPQPSDSVISGDEDLRILYTDTFESIGNWNWEGLDNGTGNWKVEEKTLFQSRDDGGLSTIALSDNKTYEFGGVRADVMLTSSLDGKNQYAGLVAAYNGAKNYYHLRLADMANGANMLQLYRMDSGIAVSLAAVELPFTIEKNVWYQLEMVMKDGVIIGLVDGTEYLSYNTYSDKNIYNEGSAGVRVSQGSARFANFAIKTPRGQAVVSDDFETTVLEDSFWTSSQTDAKEGQWSVSDGVLIQSDNASNLTTILLYDNGQDVAFGGVCTDICFTSENTGNLYAGPVASYSGAKNYYHLRLADMADGRNLLQLFRMTQGAASKIAEAELDFTIERNTWYEVEMYQEDGKIYGYVDKKLYLVHEPAEGIVYAAGLAGIRASQGSIKADNFKLYGTKAEEEDPAGTIVDNPVTFTDDFEEETVGNSPDYWLESNVTDFWKVLQEGENRIYGCSQTGVSTDTWLHVFETNVDYSADLKIPEAAGEGKAGLVIRKTGQEAYVRIGYDFGQSKWYLEDWKGLDFEKQVTYAQETYELETGSFHTVRVRAVGKKLQVYCDGTLVLERNGIQQVTAGRVGLFTEGVALWADDMNLQLLSGQGRVEKTVMADYVLDLDGYEEGASLFWHSDNLAIINFRNYLALSEDQGQTFRQATEEELEEYAFFRQDVRTQYIRLHSGNILKVDNGTGGKAYLSVDNGKTYTQVGAMWEKGSLETGWQYYGGMNDMLKEVKLADGSYRVFYCADARATGNPQGTGSMDYHWEEVYYTDDEGATWQKSAYDTRQISALNHVCESRIVSCADGDLRMYCSWNDSDCVRYYESHDNGVTWEGEYALPKLACARSSHALMEDPYEPGTYYMLLVYNEAVTWGAIFPRTRLVLLKSTDGKNWDFLMDCKRWDDVTDDRLTNINQIVDPSVTVTEDYVFVLTGWSEQTSGGSHNLQKQNVLKLRKADLTPYETWPENYAEEKDIIHIRVTAPTKTGYNVGEELDLTGGFITVSYYDGTSETVSLTDSNVKITEPDLTIRYTSVFAAPDMSASGEKILRVDYKNFADTFCITVEDPEQEGYRVSLSGADRVSAGDKVSAGIRAEHGTDQTFAAAEIVLAYDSTKLAFSEEDSVLNGASADSTKEGMVKLADYGEEKALGTIYTVVFTVLETGNASVKIGSAAFSNQADAAAKDLMEAGLISPGIAITITPKNYSVTLPDIFTGSSTVTEGEDYIFYAADAEHYDYTYVAASVNGTAVEVTDNGNGSYTVKAVDGDLVITGSRQAKIYRITYATGSSVKLPADAEITYGTEYRFTMPVEEHYAINITDMKIGDRNVNYEIQNGEVIIPGTQITGDILVTLDKVRTDAAVSVEGNGASDGKGYQPFAVPGEDYTLTVTQDDRYEYTVTATVNGKEAELLQAGNTYTVSGQDVKAGSIVFVIAKTIKTESFSVQKYLQLDNTVVWLVKADAARETEQGYSYRGWKMFWSEQYQAYVTLVFADTKEGIPVINASNVELTDGAATIIEAGFDVNMTGKADANDAQFVYNLYNNHYQTPEELDSNVSIALEKFLRADVNGDGKVDVTDAAAVIHQILSAS